MEHRDYLTWQVTVSPEHGCPWAVQFDDEDSARQFAISTSAATEVRHAPVVTKTVTASSLSTADILSDGVRVTRVFIGASKVRVHGFTADFSRTVRRSYDHDKQVVVEADKWNPRP